MVFLCNADKPVPTDLQLGQRVEVTARETKHISTFPGPLLHIYSPDHDMRAETGMRLSLAEGVFLDVISWDCRYT
jgi:hypothetical protein